MKGALTDMDIYQAVDADVMYSIVEDAQLQKKYEEVYRTAQSDYRAGLSRGIFFRGSPIPEALKKEAITYIEMIQRGYEKYMRVGALPGFRDSGLREMLTGLTAFINNLNMQMIAYKTHLDSLAAAGKFTSKDPADVQLASKVLVNSKQFVASWKSIMD